MLKPGQKITHLLFPLRLPGDLSFSNISGYIDSLHMHMRCFPGYLLSLPAHTAVRAWRRDCIAHCMTSMCLGVVNIIILTQLRMLYFSIMYVGVSYSSPLLMHSS